MLKTVGTIAVVALGAVFVPQLIENAPSPCGALATKVLSLDAGASRDLQSPLARAMVNSFAAPLVEAVVAASYPNVPAPVACSWGYWNVTLNPIAQANFRRMMKS